MNHLEQLTATLLGRKEPPVWTLVNADDEYTDYDHSLPAREGYGVRLRISFSNEYQDAHISLLIDDVDGNRYLESNAYSISKKMAVALTGYTGA
jgi:hypothetical protein